MAFQCGAGYDPDKAYIKIHDPANNESRSKLIVLTENDVAITEKGCLERPKARLFVTNTERSAGIWVAPDSANNLKLEALDRVDLPAACNSVVHGNGTGFTLNFDLPNQRPNRELQSLEVRLFHFSSGEEIYSWQSRTLESANFFAFHQEKPILSGEYRLVATVADRVSTAQSKSECTLRLDDSNLYISPADKIADKRSYNGQEVLIVQPGYNLNFYVHEGFRDVKIGYCLKPLPIGDIAPVMSARNLECLDPQDFLKTKSETLNEGFWILNYKGQRGLVETAWKHAIFLIEKTCYGNFNSVASLRGLNCTMIKGNLELKDLTNDNQRELDTIGRIAGSISIENTAVSRLDIFPNLQDVFGDIKISINRQLTEIRGFSSLSFLLGRLNMNGNNVTKIDAFQKLHIITGDVFIMDFPKLLEIAPFKQLRTIEGYATLQNLGIRNFNFLRSLQKATALSLFDLKEIDDLTGFDSLQSVQYFNISNCPSLSSLNGLPAMQSVKDLHLGPLPLVNLNGLGSITDLRDISFSDMEEFSSFLNGNHRIRISGTLNIRGNNKLKDLSELDFSPRLKTVQMSYTNIPSLKGLEKIESIARLEIEFAQSMKSLDGLDNVNELGTFSLTNSTISDISALRNLELVTEDMTIGPDTPIDNLGGLTKLKEVRGSFTLKGLPLVDLTSLPKGLIVHKNLELSSNEELLSLEGLNHISEIGGDLMIYSASHLKSLKGMEGLLVKGHAEIGYFDSGSEEDFPELTDIVPLTQVSRIGGALRLNIPSCLPDGFLAAMTPKVFGQPPAGSTNIHEGEAVIMVNQPEICL